MVVLKKEENKHLREVFIVGINHILISKMNLGILKGIP